MSKFSLFRKEAIWVSENNQWTSLYKVCILFIMLGTVSNFTHWWCVKLAPSKKQYFKRPGLLGHPKEPKRDSIAGSWPKILGLKFSVSRAPTLGHSGLFCSSWSCLSEGVLPSCTWLKHRLLCTNISFIFVSELTKWLTKTLHSSPSSRNYAETHNLCTANFLSPLTFFWFSHTVNARSIIPTLYLGKAAAWWTTVKQTTPATKRPNAQQLHQDRLRESFCLQNFPTVSPSFPSKWAAKTNPVDGHLLKLSLMASLSRTNHKI